jgi:hypothetical protein
LTTMRLRHGTPPHELSNGNPSHYTKNVCAVLELHRDLADPESHAVQLPSERP